MYKINRDIFFSTFGVNSYLSIKTKPLKRCFKRIEDIDEISDSQYLRIALLSFFDEFHALTFSFVLQKRSDDEINSWINKYKENSRLFKIPEDKRIRRIEIYKQENIERDKRLELLNQLFSIEKLSLEEYKERISYKRLCEAEDKEEFFYDYIING